MLRVLVFLMGLGFAESVLADFNGARIQYRNIDLQLSVDGDGDETRIVQLLFGSGAVVARLANLVLAKPTRKQSAAFDLFVEVQLRGDQFKASFYSGTLTNIASLFP